jgi:hypothetical protein
MKFKIGDPVILSPKSKYFGEEGQLPEGVVGKITDVDKDDSRLPYVVEWGRRSNCYGDKDLLPAPKKAKSIKNLKAGGVTDKVQELVDTFNDHLKWHEEHNEEMVKRTNTSDIWQHIDAIEKTLLRMNREPKQECTCEGYHAHENGRCRLCGKPVKQAKTKEELREKIQEI